MDDEKVDKKKIVLYGHSLGASVALHLACANAARINAIILENPFYRIVTFAFLGVFCSEFPF